MCHVWIMSHAHTSVDHVAHTNTECHLAPFAVLFKSVPVHVCHDSITSVPWLLRTCAMTHSHVFYDYFTRVGSIKVVTHSYEVAMAHMWMSHGTHVKESWHTCGGVMVHTWMSHGTHVDKSWHTCEGVMAHMWMSHNTHVKESWHT